VFLFLDMRTGYAPHRVARYSFVVKRNDTGS